MNIALRTGSIPDSQFVNIALRIAIPSPVQAPIVKGMVELLNVPIVFMDAEQLTIDIQGVIAPSNTMAIWFQPLPGEILLTKALLMA
ncbi:MAG: hypothetical protein HWD58_11140 [Bacteroidota bacterium]|nr:MAG: hypothetical protein HWD58_11140 [Bacteroidota bacterium]